MLLFFVLTSWSQAWIYHNERAIQPDVRDKASNGAYQ